MHGLTPETSLGTGVFQDPANPRGDYGPCTYDSTNLFNGSLVAVSKFGRGSLVSRLLSNWQIAPLLRDQTGLPVSPTTGKDNSLTGVGLDRPNVASSATYTGAKRNFKLHQYVNSKLYTANPLGMFGNAGEDSLRGLSYVDFEATISRSFNVSERLMLTVRVDGFNVMNHPNLNCAVSARFEMSRMAQRENL